MTQRPPAIDRHRRILSVPRRLMPSLLAVHSGSSPESAALAELRAAGLMATRRLDPLVKGLIDVMTDPTLVTTVEASPAGDMRTGPDLATFWRRGSRAVLGHSRDRHRFELIQVEPDLLPFHIAQVVNLVPRRHPDFTGSFTIPEEVLTRAEQLIATDPAQVDAELTASGVPRRWADRLIAALLLRRSVWVVESVWLGDAIGKRESRLCVLDGGFSGYWRFGANSDDTITVVPTGFDELLRRLSALLP